LWNEELKMLKVLYSDKEFVLFAFHRSLSLCCGCVGSVKRCHQPRGLSLAISGC